MAQLQLIFRTIAINLSVLMAICAMPASAKESAFNKGAIAYEAGQFAKARILYTKACEGGEALGCYNLGVMLDNVEGGSADHAQARSLYTKACEGGVEQACKLAQ
ncbi:MAG: sel1 repeat family protein [Sphingomonadales bacterium]|nr:sel1 repeat family protein [Sphingomonadales bacterium]